MQRLTEMTQEQHEARYHARRREIAAQAAATRKRRTYPSKAQKAAFRRYTGVGLKGLTVAELELLSSHPYLSQSQQNQFAALAAA